MARMNDEFPESGEHNELVTERTVLSQMYIYPNYDRNSTVSFKIYGDS